MRAMARDVFQQRCSRILAVPPELLSYQRWLEAQRAQPRSRDYLFSEARPRFEPRKDDVVVALPGLSIQAKSGRTYLRCSHPPIDIELPGMARRDAERVLAVLDGKRCLIEARWDAAVEPSSFAQFLRATFGLVVFAPDAVAALESAVSGVEITRFPGAPYGIERAYWENMVDVRAHFVAMMGALDSAERVRDCLKELHVLSLMGRSLGSYYKPASPIADQVVAPGVLYLDAPRLLERERGTLFLDGPRVNVSLLGGPAYHQALYASLEDEEALAPDRSFDVNGVSWGRYVTARSERDETFGPWFCPPRPIREEHWQKLAQDLGAGREAADHGDADETMRRMASFHQAFVRLHPFHCANQSIAMNVVNANLAMVTGVGIPHLVLDHLALRLSEPAYQRVFIRAVRAYSVSSKDPTTRLATLVDRKTASFSLIEALGRSRNASESEAVVKNDPDGARWALLLE
jgi:hypothetical protein